jgi:hypothetical protein
MNGNAQIITVRPSELKTILMFAIQNNLNTLIEGAPGIGKTYIVNQVAEALKADIEVFYSSTADPTEIKGFPFKKNETEADFLLYGQFQRLMKAKKLTIAFFDDFGQATPAVQSSLMNPLQARLINGKKLPDCIRFILATNGREHGANVHGILEPIKSRMHLIIKLIPDLDDFLSWWLDQELPVEIYAFLRSNPQRLQQFKPSKDIVNYPCPRTWEYAGKMLKAGLPKGLELACISGSVGPGDAMALLAFIDIMKDAVDPDSVIKFPDTAPVPDRTAVMFGLIGALIYRMTNKNFKPILKYAKRLSVEFASKLRHDCLKKAQKESFDIVNSTEYGDLVRYTGNIVAN